MSVKVGRSELSSKQIVARMEHVWVNAFKLVGKPDPEFSQMVGELVLRKLRESNVELDDLGVRMGNVVWLEVVSS